MRLLPDTLAGRTVLLFAGIMLLLIIGSAFLLHSERHKRFSEFSRLQVLSKVATLTRILYATETTERLRILSEVRDKAYRISLNDDPIISGAMRHPLERALKHRLQRMLPRLPRHAVRVHVHLEERKHDDEDDNYNGDEYNQPSRVPRIARELETLTFSIQLDQDAWLNIQTRQREAAPPWAKPTLGFFLLLLLVLGIIGLLMTRRLARPMAELADAADRFGLGQDPGKLRENGPIEIRRTAQAFNRMHKRLDRYMKDRSLMLAAMSHDLLTPITTLRLRAEYINDDEMRSRTLATLSEMESIVSETLNFSREDAIHEITRTVDISSLVQSICDDHADLGGTVTFKGPDRVIFNCRPIALKRAINNLIENAIKYGSEAEVHLYEKEESVCIGVRDQGPGIPEDKLEAVFTPFYRVENSRNRETGGTGLGLAVARTIAHAHGGNLTLANQPQGGLLATLTLPRL